MNIQTNLTQLELAYQTINQARMDIKSAAPDQRRAAGQFAYQAEQALNQVLTEMANKIKEEREKTLVSMT